MIYKIIFCCLLIISVSDLKLVSGEQGKAHLMAQKNSDLGKKSTRYGYGSSIQCEGLNDCIESHQNSILVRIYQTELEINKKCFSEDGIKTISGNYTMLKGAFGQFTKWVKNNIDHCLKGGCATPSTNTINNYLFHLDAVTTAVYKRALENMSQNCKGRKNVECYGKEIRNILANMNSNINQSLKGQTPKNNFTDNVKC